MVLLQALHFIPGVGLLTRLCYARRIAAMPVEIMGLRFPNPVGLAAGLDKNGKYLRPLANIGFGFIECGTVTPRPQAGNPSKRLFRIPSQRALINRLGFNNVGADRFITNLSRQDKPCILGVNIGKNRDTPDENTIQDYLHNLRALYGHADYLVINVSSPNTPGLRGLQDSQQLAQLLHALKSEQVVLAKTTQVYVPLALKIAPDLSDDQIDSIAAQVLAHKVDAVIATNTTLARPGMEKILLAKENGGLSGQPLNALSTRVIRRLYLQLQGKVPIIGVGGVATADDAWEKLVAGADLIQIYTGLIYEGPAVVKKIVRGLARRVNVSGQTTLAAAVAKARSGTHLMR